jgi:mono/diheme cytochrome c family protein
MKDLSIFGAAFVCLLVSCESTNYAPPLVASEMAKVGTRQNVDLATLREGRVLFVSRCIECHTLPAVFSRNLQEWPRLVDKMSGRANLKPHERDAIVAYLRAARSQ